MQLNLNETALANGLRVATSSMPQVESVSVGIWVGVGGRYEAARHSGVSHFIEHLLFKGTKKRSALQITQEIEGRGGYVNAFTQEESTCYYARITRDSLSDAFDVLADMVLHPAFALSDIEKERGVVLEEIMMYRDQPHHLVQDTLGELMWADHPLGRPLIGTPQTVAGMSRKEILAFKKGRYVPGAMLVSIAGGVEHSAGVALVRKQLGRLKAAGAPRPFAPVTRRVGQLPVKVISKDVEQTHLALGVRLFGRFDRRRYALKLLSVLLGENMSSRLFQVVRERHGLAYSVHSSLQLFDETGALHISAGLDRRRAPRAFSLIAAELARLRERPVSSAELRRAKDYASGQLRLGLESASNQMMWAGENIMSYGRLIQPSEVLERIERVTPADIQALAGQVLRSDRMSWCVVGPGDPEPCERHIRSVLDGFR